MSWTRRDTDLLGTEEESVAQYLFKYSKVLGPEVLSESALDSRLSPFEIKWTFGFDIAIPVINLSNDIRRVVFYTAANVGILYDYCKQEMVHLRGHQNRIAAASVDRSGRWLVTADNGEDNVVMVWDTILPAVVWTIFNYPDSHHSVTKITMSRCAKLLVTISDKNETTIDFWLWTYGKTEPDDSWNDDESSLGAPKSIEFHPNRGDHLMVVFEKSVLFFCWDYETRKVSSPVIPRVSIKNIGHYTDGTYVDLCHEAFVSTSKGNILVFGNTIFARGFNKDEAIDNNKMYVKSIKVTKGSITCMTSIDEIIVIGDSNGTIMFFDKRLKLLYWVARQFPKSICTISFKLVARKYKYDYSQVGSDVTLAEMPDCQDRSDEYESLIVQILPRDATLERYPFFTRDAVISTADGTIYMMYLPSHQFTPLFPVADSHVAAIDVHEDEPYLVVAYSKGRIITFNYETHEEVISTVLPETDPDSTITAIKYSGQCLHFACGKSNGELWVLQPAIMAQIYIEPFKFGDRKICQIAFTKSSLQMAYYDDNNTIFGFYYDTEAEDWVFKGKVRSHYKEIYHMLFLDEEPYGLFTIGKDRNLIKYTDLVADEEEIDIAIRDRVEQKDIPLYFIPYTKTAFSKSGYFLVADDKHKYKIINNRTNMCTAVFLGPAYGCFQNSPVSKMEFVPKSDKQYLIFKTKKQIGLQLMPIDGNPYKFVGCNGHPEELLDFQISHDGKYVFTIGKQDRTVFMWKINLKSVETMQHLGGKELQPYYCLIDGGRGGFLYQEMRDLFYYMQILQQGEEICAPRVISDTINITELPDLMRACGYYPSEYEIENLLTDIRYKEFDTTGILRDKVNFCEFVKLFINHKPAYGYAIEQLEECFETITTFSDDFGGRDMSREDLVEAVTTTGEQVTTEHIYKCLTTLLHVDPIVDDQMSGEKDFSFLADTIDFDYLAEDILGINLDEVTREEDKDEPSASFGYGYHY